MSAWQQVRPGAAVTNGGDRLLLCLRDAARILTTFPAGKVHSFERGGVTFVTVPLRSDSLRLLGNLGYNVRGLECLRYQYNAPRIEQRYEPMAHQISTAGFLSENPRAFCTSTMRTGKTASTIIAADYLQRNHGVRAVLIVCTVSTMRGVWKKEIEGMLPHARVQVCHGKHRESGLERTADYYIINYDGLKYVTAQLETLVDNGCIDVCIVDELTHYANAKTARWAVADSVINGTRSKVTTPGGRRQRLPPGRPITYVWGLTGTPGKPEGIYGQIKLVNPVNMNMGFIAWREMVMYKINQFKWIPSHGHKEIIKQRMQPCIRFDKADIMDLPPVVFQSRECDLSADQDKFYKRLKREMILQTANGAEVKAANKAALISKLLQVSCGVVRGADDTLVTLDAKPRIDLINEIISESETKVVIFSAFTAVLDMLVKELGAKHRVALVDGRVTGKKRDEVFYDFQHADKLDVLLCHPQTTAFGVELSAADTMIFYGPPMSGEFVYQQAIERLSSLSQKASQVGIVHLTSSAEERKLFAAIKDGVQINEAINDVFAEATKN